MNDNTEVRFACDRCQQTWDGSGITIIPDFITQQDVVVCPGCLDTMLHNEVDIVIGIKALTDKLAEHERLMTLVECSKCGKGYRVREMAEVNGERWCVSCLADALTGSYEVVKLAQREARHYQDMIGPLRDALASVKDGFVDASRLDPEDYQYSGVGLVYPEVVVAVHTALNGAGNE